MLKYPTIAVWMLLMLTTSCVGTRYLETNQSLVIKNAEIEGVKGNLKEDLEDLIRQKPNKRLLGFIPFTYLVYMYEIGNNRFDTANFQQRIDDKKETYLARIANSDKDKKINKLTIKMNSIVDELTYKKNNGNWFMQTGEPLAVYDSTKTEQTLTYFKNHMISNGYFDHTIEFSIQEKKHSKVYGKYVVTPANRYKIDSIIYMTQDTLITNLLFNNIRSLPIKKGSPYSQKALENERDRIYNLMTNNGYFTFSRQYISFEIDTFSLEHPRIILSEKILKPSIGNHQQFSVDSIQFFSTNNQSLGNKQLVSQNGIRYQFGEKEYAPDILDSRIYIQNDSLYSRQNTIRTQQQLSYLDAFKFVNINYDSIESQRLLANIFTSPLDKYQSSIEIGAVTASQQIPGPFINLGYKNRNAFKSLDIFELQGNISSLGISSVGTDTSRYSLFQYGASIGYTLPKFLFFKTNQLKNKVGSINPQSRFRLSYNYEDRIREYERYRAEFSYSYLWRREDRSTFNFTPFTFSYIDVQKLEPEFRDFLNEQASNGNGALEAAFNSSIVSSSSFEAVYNFASTNQINDNSFLRLFIESGGNLVNLLGEDFFLWSGQTSVDEFSFFRWAKFNIDYRSVHRIKAGSKLAYRINFGVAFPYGKNPSLPYEKRFYIGGSNSLRAWQVRRLGPGSYGILSNQFESSPTLDLVNYQQEQGGDMILEMSLELRKKLVGFVDYALFVDAGNIWLINSNTNLSDTHGDDGYFRINSFWKEIAVGAGVGLRLDFSFFVFRLDGAVQVIDPAQAIGNRWVIDDINFGDILRPKNWNNSTLQNKTNITLGIGLPF